MTELSLRQKVFELLDNDSELDNKALYDTYPKESKNSLRTYRNEYFKKLESSISKMKVSDKNDISNLSNFKSDISNIRRIYPSSKNPSKTQITTFFRLFNTFKSLPLFIYSKIYSIIRERHSTNKRNYPNAFIQEEHDPESWNFSYYTLYMEVINDISLGVYNDEISLYDIDHFQLFANSISQQMFSMDFKKELIEEVRYWSEEEFEEKMKEVRLIQEDPNETHHDYYNRKSYEEYYDWFRKFVEEGYCNGDYEDEKDYIEGLISECFETIGKWDINYTTFTLNAFNSLRSKLLYHVYFELFDCSEFHYRANEVSKKDIRQIIMEYNLYNIDKKNFMEEIDSYNCRAVGFDEDTMTILIEKDFYIDLGKHGEEYLGLRNMPFSEKNDSGLYEVKGYKEVYFDTIKFE